MPSPPGPAGVAGRTPCWTTLRWPRRGTGPGTSLEESKRVAERTEVQLREVPEVAAVARRPGRAEQDEHAEGVNSSELEVRLTPPTNGYRYVYQFIEPGLGAAYLANFQPLRTNAATLAAMGVGTVGVVQSRLARRKIRCACLGGPRPSRPLLGSKSGRDAAVPGAVTPMGNAL